jgi:hypothetical protein
MHDKFQEYVNKERNREELITAIHSNPIFDNWRQIMTVLIACLIIGGVFATRSRRFKQVMNKLESTPALTRKPRPKFLPPAQIADPDIALARAEKMWAAQESEQKRLKSAAAAGTLGPEDEEFLQQMGEDQKKKNALAGRLERIANGDVKEALRTPPPKNLGAALGAMTAAQAGSSSEIPTPDESEVQPLPVRPDSIGIANGDPEPVRNAMPLDALHKRDYQMVNQIPAPYTKEKDEFPDLQ